MSAEKGRRFSNELRKSLDKEDRPDAGVEDESPGWDPYEVWRTRVKDPQEYRLSLKPRPWIEE